MPPVPLPLCKSRIANDSVPVDPSAVFKQGTVAEGRLANGNETLALATPAKPRIKHSHPRDLHTYRHQGAFGKVAPGSDYSGPSDMFVAETPMLPSGRHQDFGSRLNGLTSQVSADLPYRLHGDANDADDLADFMVDTDEEDDGALFSGRKSLPSELALERRNGKQLVAEVAEVPETPMKAV